MGVVYSSRLLFIVAFHGKRLRAQIIFEGGKATVADSSSGRRGAIGSELPIIQIRGADESIQRIVTAVTTPFEEHLQRECQVVPTMNEPTTRLLEILFPRHVPYVR